MTPVDCSTQGLNEELTAALLDYLEATEKGLPQDRHLLFERYPQFATELDDFFTSCDRVEGIVAPLRMSRMGSNQITKAYHPHAPSKGFIEIPNPNRFALFPPVLISAMGVDFEPCLLGDFWLSREIGRGGMGIVYEAEQVSLRRRVALKVLPFTAGLDARQLQRITDCCAKEVNSARSVLQMLLANDADESEIHSAVA
jgi:eukaryotic-like serine/threonine-protein kinase